MDWNSSSTEDMWTVLEVLDKQLWDMKLADREPEVQARVRAFVMSELEDPGDASWASWFPLVASVFLYMGDGGQLSARLFAYVITAARVITERSLPCGAPAFPGEKPARCWSGAGWDRVGTPPPIQRAGQPVRSPRCREWEQPGYDVWQWDVMYDLVTRLTFLGDLSMLDFHPVSGIDPEIVYPPDLDGDPAFDHAVAVDSRPPMGLVVACLLAREIAYFYAVELSCDAIGNWIFEIVAGKSQDPHSRPPRWLAPDLEARFKTLEPAAVLAFCERAFQHLAEITAGISPCDG